MRKNISTCQKCGSKIEYNPQIKALKCISCGAVEQIKVFRAKERSFNLADPKIKQNNLNKTTKSIKCQRCGAVEVLNKNDLSERCPFCGNTTVVDVANEEVFSPTAIMPFTITKQEAKFAFIDKIKRNLWVPRKLKKSIKLKDPQGVYAPVYSFDASAYCNYNGTVARDEEVSHYINGEWETTTERKYIHVSGSTEMRVDDLLIDAGQVINEAILRKLEPFDSNNSVEFDDRFLYGFSANQSKKSLSFAYNQACDSVKAMLEKKIVQIHNADAAGELNIDLFMNNVTYKYILLPVYLNGFSYGKKTYTLYCNGTTSEVAGKLPVSKGKVLGTVIGILAVVGAIAAAILLSI